MSTHCVKVHNTKDHVEYHVSICRHPLFAYAWEMKEKRSIKQLGMLSLLVRCCVIKAVKTRTTTFVMGSLTSHFPKQSLEIHLDAIFPHTHLSQKAADIGCLMSHINQKLQLTQCDIDNACKGRVTLAHAQVWWICVCTGQYMDTFTCFCGSVTILKNSYRHFVSF